MFDHSFKIRVPYADTDKMGLLHHSNYLRYYESARWELLRNIGILYSEIEDEGYILPVTSASIKYIKPCYYDQLLTIQTKLVSYRGPRILFDYQIFSESGELVNEASVTVACAGKEDGKACHTDGLLKELFIKVEKERG